MNKKICIFVLTIIAVVVCFCGCSTVEDETNDEEHSMFVYVEKTDKWYVVYNKETKVMYSISRGAYNLCSFTLLVNEDGTPMLWEGAE